MQKNTAQGSARRAFNCPAELTISLIGGKWRAILLYNLRKNPRRFGELRRLSPGITPAVLTKELRALIEYGLVRRRQLSRDTTDGVEYALTEKGASLKPALYALVRWGIAHRQDYVLGDFGMSAFSRE